MVFQSNPIDEFSYRAGDVDYAETVQLSDRRLVKIDRLRLLSDPGFPMWDISYCWGTLDDGRHVMVDLGASQLSKARALSELIDLAKKAGRYAKGLGLLDRFGVWSTMNA